MRQPHLTPAEIAAKGREIYEKTLRAELEPESSGKFVVIDVETGEYEVDADGDAASLRAFKRKPDGIRYGMRIGHRAWGRIGIGSGAHVS